MASSVRAGTTAVGRMYCTIGADGTRSTLACNTLEQRSIMVIFLFLDVLLYPRAPRVWVGGDSTPVVL